MRKRWIYLGGMVLLIAIVLATFLEPNRIVRGYLAGEAFCLHRPTSYWREILREDGRRGIVSAEVRERVGWGHESLPVLLECARDPDENVRWPAINLIGRTRLSTERTLSALMEALGDEEIEVRLQAIGALRSWGPRAQPAFTHLAALLKDPEDQVADAADIALWEIDLPAAVEASCWERFTSPEWEFSVMMPRDPKYGRSKSADALVDVHTFTARHRVTFHAISVCEDPPGYTRDLPDEDRYNLARDSAVAGLQGKLVSEQSKELHGRKGRELLIEVERDSKPIFLRTHLLWVRPRLYLVYVSFTPGFLNERAANYFLNSFRLEDGPREVIPAPHALSGP